MFTVLENGFIHLKDKGTRTCCLAPAKHGTRRVLILFLNGSILQKW